ncbi:hypothetical protein [Cytobacillus praedii]|uniref:hypothetical protein n=1 Tax=Cytobacillus praedii TaxID=1742358 RepID=UPI002E1A1497|nr:hypothetical protein [Cytobacillus praedii]
MRSMKLDLLKGVPGIQGKKVSLFKTKTPGLVKFQAGLSLQVKKTVSSIEWDYQEGRSAGKAAVGAIGGGVLLGPLGLIAGAALGGKKNEVSTAVINFEEGGYILVRMTAKECEALHSWLS